MNDLNDEVKDAIGAVCKRSNEELGFTVSGNPFTKDVVLKL
jgi:hypothetical protein